MGTPEAALGPLEASFARGGRASLLPLAAGVLAWELGARLAGGMVPPASAVVLRLVTMLAGGPLRQALLISIGSLAVGVVIGWLLGTVVGVLFARSPVVDGLFSVYFDALMSVPTAIYVPVLFSVFGVSRGSQIAIVASFTFFLVAATTTSALRGVPPGLVDMARAFGASRRQQFFAVELPAAAPRMLTGLRAATMRAVKGMLIGEMIIAIRGIGGMLKTFGVRLDVAGILALVLAIVGVALLADAVVVALGRAVLPRLSRAGAAPPAP